LVSASLRVRDGEGSGKKEGKQVQRGIKGGRKGCFGKSFQRGMELNPPEIIQLTPFVLGLPELLLSSQDEA